jgi:thiamine-phosphate diphosphorylase
VGRSVHSAEEARAVAPDALDYVELGTIFPSRSHPGGQTLGLDAIRGAAGCGVPIVAVGGITPENAGAVIAAGADGVAVITAILGQRDPGAAAARLCEAAQTAWSQRELTPSPSGR